MKKFIFILITLTSVIGYSQKEANTWYFGNKAGLDFSSGEPVALLNGELSTVEGCASISDVNGNLLFYTDGQLVYNSNHLIMNNGTGLHGNSSSTQSAIVVPKPNKPNQYYIFTVDEHNSNINGLQYSIVDMALDGGLGGVISSEKNRPLLQHCSEKITAVKGDDCDSIWVIAYSSPTGIFANYATDHFFDSFHAFKVTSTGVESSIISTFSNSTADGRGYLKVSANGSKIAIANSIDTGKIKLYDFDIITGQVSNEKSIFLNDSSHANNNTTTEAYGIEFSLNSSILYVTSIASGRVFNETPQDGFLWQYDVFSASNNAELISFNPTTTYRGALQMGPNGKIYRALSSHYLQGSNFLGVINNPNNLGITCNYQHNAINLGTGVSRQGLPPFIQSLFLPNVDIINNSSGALTNQIDLCTGDTYTLQPDISTFPASTTYEWTKDGVPFSPSIITSSLIVDGVTYTTGNYRILIDFNDGTCPFYGEAQVDYHDNPIITSPITIKQCDDDTDGVSFIDLTLANENISVNASLETFTYYQNQIDAENNNTTLAIANADNYETSSTGASPLWVRVDNGYCYTVGQVNIIVSAANTNFNRTLYQCDDYLDDVQNDFDGITAFNLIQIEPDLLLEFDVSQQPTLTFDYYHSIDDAVLQTNKILDPSAYRNITTTTTILAERIYIRVNNDSNIDCVGMGSNLYIDLIVEELPIAHDVTELRVCEIAVNAEEGLFDTSLIPNQVLLGQTDVTLSYYEKDLVGNLIEIPNTTFISTAYLSETTSIIIRATSDFTNVPDGPCFHETTLNLIVDDLPIVNTVSIQPLCDDLPNQNDTMSIFDTETIKLTLFGGQLPDNMEAHYYNENGSEILPTLPKYFNTSTQTVHVVVINKDNSNCTAETDLFFEIVIDNPIFDIPNQLLCVNSNAPTILEVSVENPQNSNYTYHWEGEQGEVIPTILNDTSTAIITKGGVYSVTATSLSQCDTKKFFTVVESSIPFIETVTIFDNSSSNQVSILVSGQGDYEFAMDENDFTDTNELHGHIFNNVSEGLHTIKINDKNGCTPIVTLEVIVIRFPKFITPNFDGVNDEFFVFGGDDFQVSEVIIFDRFGKIIKTLTSNESWDGTSLGAIALQTEYWFTATFIDNQGKVYSRRGHFSLKH